MDKSTLRPEKRNARRPAGRARRSRPATDTRARPAVYDHRHLTDRLLPAVLAAGRLELDLFERGCAVTHKADRSPVTRADTEAEALLLAALAVALPDVVVVSEEAFAGGYRPVPSDPFVLVDPLDGTKQFVAGEPEFTVNVALVEGGRPTYGLVYAPALGDLMVTDGPGRALRMRLDPGSIPPTATLDDLAPRPITVRRERPGGLVALQSRARNASASDAYLAAYDIARRRKLGSSYKFCLIACGEADIYPQLGDTSEWDTAAGEALVLAAGGTVVTLADGTPTTYGRHGRNFRNPPFVAASRPLAELPRPHATAPPP
jgi:3'(2'), 5'-bisphosphate nucleotidase